MPDSIAESQALSIADFEYKLTVATRTDCWCGRYLIERREVLLPEIVKQFFKQDEVEEIDDFVHTFTTKLHEQKCPTQPQPQPEPFVEQLMRRLRDSIDENSKVKVGSGPYPVECLDCHAGVGQPCVSGCPHLDH